MGKRELERKYTKKEDLVFREEEDFGLLFDIKTGKTHKLNHSAVTIWKSIDDDTTVADIIKILEKEYGNVDTLHNDILDFILFLKKIKYIGEKK